MRNAEKLDISLKKIKPQFWTVLNSIKGALMQIWKSANIFVAIWK